MGINISKNFYRKEIQGLRAIAVLGIILSNLNFTFFRSGYLGVDIFFVISGFVMTSSVINNINSQDFWGFTSELYAKRIKKFVPVISFYVIILSVLVCLFIPPQGIIITIRTGISSLFGVSNLYLLKRNTDFFAHTNILNPFSHTWSLAVIEQFYFFFPIIFWISKVRGSKSFTRNLFCTILFLFTLSFSFFIIFCYLDISKAFFLMPTRFWEISAGSLAFLSYEKIHVINITKKIPSSILFLLIIGLLSLPTQITPLSIVLMVLILVLFLLSIKKNTLLYKLLTTKFILFIGSISYSLFLWQFGVLSISKWLGLDNSIGIIFLQIFIIFTTSIISFNTLERKFRNSKERNKKVFLFGILWMIYTSFFVLFPIKNLITFRDKNQPKIKTTINLFDESISDKKCIKSQNYPIQWTQCEALNSPQESVIIMTGDSQSRTLIPLANEFLKKDNFDFISYSLSGTISPAIPFTYRNRPVNYMFEKIERQKSYLKQVTKYINEIGYRDKYLWIFNDMNFYFYGREWQKDEVIFLDANQKEIKSDIAFNIWLESLKELIQKANEKNIKVVYFGSLPSIKIGYEVICAEESISYSENINQFCIDNVIKRRSSIQGKYFGQNFENNILNLHKQHDNFIYIDTAKTFCKDLNRCEIYKKNKIYLMDNVHISVEKAIDLYPLIKSKINSLK